MHEGVLDKFWIINRVITVQYPLKVRKNKKE